MDDHQLDDRQARISGEEVNGYLVICVTEFHSSSAGKEYTREPTEQCFVIAANNYADVETQIERHFRDPRHQSWLKEIKKIELIAPFPQ